MGMSDDMDSIAIAMNGIELSKLGISSVVSEISSSITDYANRAQGASTETQQAALASPDLEKLKAYQRKLNAEYEQSSSRDNFDLIDDMSQAINDLGSFSADLYSVDLYSTINLATERTSPLSSENIAGINKIVNSIVSSLESGSGLSPGVATKQESRTYTIEIMVDGKLQTITTLNDPADFLAALTGN